MRWPVETADHVPESRSAVVLFARPARAADKDLGGSIKCAWSKAHPRLVSSPCQCLGFAMTEI